jgi:hypothetical protein
MPQSPREAPKKTARKFVRRAGWLALLASWCACAPALATTKGLSQIVTPELQPPGSLSLSVQAQARQIGNPYELQAEMGLTRWLEVAAFQGLSPGEQILGAEVGLIQGDPWLLSAGVVNWSTRDQSAQPFVEGGYYTEHDKFIAGPIVVHNRTQALLGWAHDFNDVWRFQLDYQSGRDNYFTMGFTCSATPNFQFNPALYFSNAGGHRALGYFVMSYTFSLWQNK